MRRRRRFRPARDDIELNLAAMLDMAFQLLMFFILTFNPAPPESQIAAYLPSPRPVTSLPLADGEDNSSRAGDLATAHTSAHDATPNPPTDSPDPQRPLQADPITVTVVGSSSGGIQSLHVGEKTVVDLADLNAALHDAVCREGDNCDRLAIRVDAHVKYEELLQVVEICTLQKTPEGRRIANLKLVELRRK